MMIKQDQKKILKTLNRAAETGNKRSVRLLMRRKRSRPIPIRMKIITEIDINKRDEKYSGWVSGCTFDKRKIAYKKIPLGSIERVCLIREY
jgi:hypothetical protein